MKNAWICWSVIVFSVFVFGVAYGDMAQPTPLTQGGSTEVEPGLTYGKSDALALPKTIIFSASPDEIIADAEEWARRGIQAFFLNYVAREWSSDIWARDGKPWTIGASDETFQKAVQANAVCRRIGSETFLKIAFDNCFEWFNDLAWGQAYHNFRQFAIFARETGCTGMALDIEYVGEQYDFEWEGYTYDGYTRADLVAKIRERMLGVSGEVALKWGELSGESLRRGVGVSMADGLIGATAIVHSMTVVTRNVADLEKTGALVLNPWED